MAAHEWRLSLQAVAETTQDADTSPSIILRISRPITQRTTPQSPASETAPPPKDLIPEELVTSPNKKSSQSPTPEIVPTPTPPITDGLSANPVSKSPPPQAGVPEPIVTPTTQEEDPLRPLTQPSPDRTHPILVSLFRHLSDNRYKDVSQPPSTNLSHPRVVVFDQRQDRSSLIFYHSRTMRAIEAGVAAAARGSAEGRTRSVKVQAVIAAWDWTGAAIRVPRRVIRCWERGREGLELETY